MDIDIGILVILNFIIKDVGIIVEKEEDNFYKKIVVDFVVFLEKKDEIIEDILAFNNGDQIYHFMVFGRSI